MDTFHGIYQMLDPYLIVSYRMSDIPIVGFYLGTAVLALVCVFIGQLTIFTAFSANSGLIRRQNRQMVRMQNLSVRALLSKDKKAFKSCNQEANDAFGKVFFSQIALGASSLWPIPFALGWMQTRFGDVRFDLPLEVPVLGSSVGFPFTFIPIYILVYIAFNKVKHHLPVFRTIEKRVAAVNADNEKMVSFAELAR